MAENSETVASNTTAGRVIKNAVFNSSGWAITVLFSLLTTPYIIYKMSPEGYGIYALLTGLVGYYALLDLGLGQGVIKYVAHHRAKNDNENISNAINSALCAQALAGFAASFLLVVFCDPILNLFKISANFRIDARIGLYASAVGFFFVMLTGTLSATLMGLQRYDINAKVDVAANLALNLTIVYLLFAGYGLTEIMIATALFAIINFIVYLILVRKALPHWKFMPARQTRYFRELFSFSSHLFFSKISVFFYNYFARFIIASVVGPAAVTYYVVPMKLINAFYGFLVNLTSVLFPFASEMAAVERRDKLQRAYLQASKYILTAAFPVFLLLIFLSQEILTAWLGADFAAKGWLIMSLLAASYLLSSLTMVPANIAFGLGCSRTVVAFSSLVTFLAVVFIAPLTYLWGVVGVATGILLTQIASPIFIVFITRNVMHDSLRNLIKKVFSFHLIALLPAGSFLAISHSFFDLSYPLALITFCGLFVTIYYGACLLVKWVSPHEIYRTVYARA